MIVEMKKVTLLCMAQDRDAMVRWGAGIALGLCGSERAVPALLGLAHDDEQLPAVSAMWALDKWPSEESAQALEHIAANENHEDDLRKQARGAAREVREKMRLEAEAPDDDGKQ